MASLNIRFPNRQELFKLFLVCVFPIHFWSILIFLREVPVFILRLSAVDILSVFAYTQVFALLESSLLLCLITVLGLLLPRSLFRERFVLQGSILVLITSIWAIPINYKGGIFALSLENTGSLLIVWSLSCLGAIIVLSILLHRSIRFNSILQGFIEKLSLLSMLYASVGLISILIIIIRSLTLLSS